jgi:ABC-type branched-subunit amino acid transport system ATPase component
VSVEAAREPAVRLAVMDVEAGYGPVVVLRGLSLSLHEGRVTTLLGPNGAGKSTTCQTIAGILAANSGSVFLGGEDITALPCWKRAHRGLFLTPEGRGIFPSLTVEDNLRLSIRDRAERERIYERFGNLATRRRTAAGNLSGGEQQMLALSPALAQSPQVLVVDEPTLGLAPIVAEEVLDLFSELKRTGTAILLVGESPRGLLEMADDAALISGGRIVWSGRGRDLDANTLEQAYFSAGRIE